MTEEIKELLDILNKVKDYDDKRYFISCGENDYLLTNDEIKALLNYITNLQNENENLKQWDCNKDTRNSRQRTANKNLLKQLEDYKQRNEKAIDELFELKNMIYKPETREENFEIQRKISSIIKKLGLGSDE